jgi:hypothetical protein
MDNGRTMDNGRFFIDKFIWAPMHATGTELQYDCMNT